MLDLCKPNSHTNPGGRSESVKIASPPETLPPLVSSIPVRSNRMSAALPPLLTNRPSQTEQHVGNTTRRMHVRTYLDDDMSRQLIDLDIGFIDLERLL